MRKNKVIPQQDKNGRPIITKEYLKNLCEYLDKYTTPELNDSLYLNCKGFKKMENLSDYFNLKALYFDNNMFNKIQNIGKLKELRCLFLQRNKISKIEGLENLQKLHTLNLSHNEIKKIENLENIKSLENLNLGFNEFKNKESIELILKNKKITTFNLENNFLDCDENVIDDIFSKMESLKVLYLKQNPFVKKIKNYRKNLISKISTLTYLDTRPVKRDERRLAEIYLKKGIEGERDEKVKIQKEKNVIYKRYLDEIRKARKNAKNTKINDLMRYKDEVLKDINIIILKKNKLKKNLKENLKFENDLKLENGSNSEKNLNSEKDNIEVDTHNFEIKKLDKEIKANSLQMELINKKIEECKNDKFIKEEKKFYKYEKVDKNDFTDKGDAIEESVLNENKENNYNKENKIKNLKEDSLKNLSKNNKIENINNQEKLIKKEKTIEKILDIQKLLDFENQNNIYWTNEMVKFLQKELEKNNFDFNLTDKNFKEKFNMKISEKDLRKKWTELIECEKIIELEELD